MVMLGTSRGPGMGGLCGTAGEQLGVDVGGSDQRMLLGQCQLALSGAGLVDSGKRISDKLLGHALTWR